MQINEFRVFFFGVVYGFYISRHQGVLAITRNHGWKFIFWLIKNVHILWFHVGNWCLGFYRLIGKKVGKEGN